MSVTAGQISMTFGIHIHGTQRMFPNDSLILHPVSSSGPKIPTLCSMRINGHNYRAFAVDIVATRGLLCCITNMPKFGLVHKRYVNIP